MKRSLDEWMHKGLYLPPFLRDFHDQKDVFKCIDEIVGRSRDKSYGDLLPGWVGAHIYVVDFFLWYMARRGWTLQRSRQPLDFVEMDTQAWRASLPPLEVIDER